MDEQWGITVVDRDDVHVYEPGLLLVPLGQLPPAALAKRRRRLLDPGVELILGEVDRTPRWPRCGGASPR